MPPTTPLESDGLPSPYGNGFEHSGPGADPLERRFAERERKRRMWGILSHAIALRILRVVNGLLVTTFALIILLWSEKISLEWATLTLFTLLLAGHVPPMIAAENAWLGAQDRLLLGRKSGRVYESIAGTDRLLAALSSSRRDTWIQSGYALSAVIIMGLVTWLPLEYQQFNSLLLLQAVMGIALTYHCWLTIDDSLDHADPLPFLTHHTPASHPAHLKSVLSDTLLAHLDPETQFHWKDWNEGLEAQLLPDVELSDARERLLYLLHLEKEGLLETKQVNTELKEFLSLEGLRGFLEDDIRFSRNGLQRLLRHTGAWQPSLFRLLDRLQFDLLDGKRSCRSNGWRLDCEMEEFSLNGQGDLFVFVNNFSGQTESISIAVEVPGGEPSDQHFQFPLESISPPIDPLPLHSSESEDVIEWVATHLDKGSLLWLGCSWPRGAYGKRPIQVTLMDDEGVTLAAMTLSTKVSKRRDGGTTDRRRRLLAARREAVF